MNRSKLHLAIAAAGLGLALTGAALAQGRSAESLRASGQVGEDASGLMACRTSCDAAVSAAVEAINDQRKRVYQAAADETRTTLAAAGEASFRSRLSCTNVPAQTCIKAGDWYRPVGGGWTRK